MRKFFCLYIITLGLCAVESFVPANTDRGKSAHQALQGLVDMYSSGVIGPKELNVVLEHWANHCCAGAVPAVCVQGVLSGYDGSPDQSAYLADCINVFQKKMPVAQSVSRRECPAAKTWAKKVVDSQDKLKTIKETTSEFLQAIAQLAVGDPSRAFSLNDADYLKKRESMQRVGCTFAGVFSEYERTLAWHVFLWKSVLIPSIVKVSNSGGEEKGWFAKIINTAADLSTKYLKNMGEFLLSDEVSALSRDEVHSELMQSHFVQKLQKAIASVENLGIRPLSEAKIREDRFGGVPKLLSQFVWEHELYRCCADFAEGERDMRRSVEYMLSLVAQRLGNAFEDGVISYPRACDALALSMGHLAYMDNLSGLVCLDNGAKKRHPILADIASAEVLWSKGLERSLLLSLRYIYAELAVYEILESCQSLFRKKGDLRKLVEKSIADGSDMLACAFKRYQLLVPLDKAKECLVLSLPNSDQEWSEELENTLFDALWRPLLESFRSAEPKKNREGAEISIKSVQMANLKLMYQWLRVAAPNVAPEVAAIIAKREGKSPPKKRKCLRKKRLVRQTR